MSAAPIGSMFVICDAPQCRHVWMIPAMVAESGSGHFMGNIYSPCPKCGSTGRIPDGFYTALKQVLDNPADRELIVSQLNSIAESIGSGAGIQQIEKEIKSRPLISWLGPLVPKTPGDLVAWGIMIEALAKWFQDPSVQETLNHFFNLSK